MKKLTYIFALALIPNFVYADAPPEKAFLAPVTKTAAPAPTKHSKKTAKAAPAPAEPAKVAAPAEPVAAPAPAPAAPK